jgi:hypothetical protein
MIPLTNPVIVITLNNSVILSASRSFAKANDRLKSKDPTLAGATTASAGNSHENL